MTLTVVQNVTQVSITAEFAGAALVLNPVVNVTNGTVAGYESVRVIDGYYVNTIGNTNRSAIEVGNIITGIKDNRYIVAKVDALPYTEDDNLTFYVTNIE